jgi:aryl-alcohol dehydrogenase-like predicted oxidoreductase
VYGDGASEELLGDSIRANRDEVFIATKFGLRGMDPGVTGGSASWIRTAVDRSLRRLGTDWIDLYQIHTPDSVVDQSETLGALNDLVVAGKVREIGCSNYDAELLDNSLDISVRESFAAYTTIQNRYSLLHREPESEVLEVCKDRKIGFLPYFPLESGLLTGKVSEAGPLPGTRLAEWPADRLDLFLSDSKIVTVKRLEDWVDSRGRSLLELAVSWLLMNPSVPSIIAGATSAEQLLANARAADWVLSDIEMAEVNEILTDATSHLSRE